LDDNFILIEIETHIQSRRWMVH